MKQLTMKILLLLVLFFSNTIIAQKVYDGWVVNNDNDTVQCKVASPSQLKRKLKLRMRSYFYDYIYVKDYNGKERRFTTDDIKEYYFEFFKNGKKEKFHAALHKISHNTGFIVKRKNAGYFNVFARKLVSTGYYHLYYYEQRDWVDGTDDKNFILYKPSDTSSIVFYSNKNLMRLLNWPPEGERKKERYKSWFIGKQYLVMDYNKLKEKLK